MGGGRIYEKKWSLRVFLAGSVAYDFKLRSPSKKLRVRHNFLKDRGDVFIYMN